VFFTVLLFAAPASRVAPPPPPPPASTDAAWHYDPNTGYHYQLSSATYYDSKKQMYSQGGKWSKVGPMG